MSLVSLLVLTEDSAKDSPRTLEALINASVHFLYPNFQEQQIKFDTENEAAKKATHANLWKGDHGKTVTICRAIATKLKRTGGFVVFHFDGDKKWANRADCENRQFFEKKILAILPTHLAPLPSSTPPKQRLTTPMDRTPKPIEPSTEALLAKLITMVPFYCIESWLYQNTTEALRICNGEKHSGRDAEKFEAWSKNRQQLDEIEQPKEKTCLWSDYNHELARRDFPVQEVHGVEKSFHAFVEDLRRIATYLERHKEFSDWWGFHHFALARLPNTKTIEEIERWIVVLETVERLTEEEAAARFQGTTKSDD